MAWGSKQTATQLTSITTEQFFSFGGSSYVSLNPGESAYVQVTADPPATPTDNLLVAVYGTLDASSETSDATPFMEFAIDKGTDPNIVSFVVSGVYRFRIGVRRSGTTDTYTDADCSYRLDGVSL
jgi:hypothetical protein